MDPRVIVGLKSGIRFYIMYVGESLIISSPEQQGHTHPIEFVASPCCVDPSSVTLLPHGVRLA